MDEKVPMTRKELIRAYFDRFGEGPPIFGMDETAAIMLMSESLREGRPIEQGAEQDAPPGALL